MSLAMTALRLSSEYDHLRLRTYQDRGPRGDWIKTASIGSALALRFDDVSYFNRVYAPDSAISERLADIEAFYQGSPFGCELIGPTIGCADNLDQACVDRRWAPGGRYAWVAERSAMIATAHLSDFFEIRPPDDSEKELFLLTYLRGFESGSANHAAAVQTCAISSTCQSCSS